MFSTSGTYFSMWGKIGSNSLVLQIDRLLCQHYLLNNPLFPIVPNVMSYLPIYSRIFFSFLDLYSVPLSYFPPWLYSVLIFGNIRLMLIFFFLTYLLFLNVSFLMNFQINLIPLKCFPISSLILI